MFAPKDQPYVEFESSEQINNYLLRDPEVQAHLRKRGGTPMIVMVFFDDETEEICRELGYQLIIPSDELRLRTATPSAGGTWPRCTCGRS